MKPARRDCFCGGQVRGHKNPGFVSVITPCLHRAVTTHCQIMVNTCRDTDYVGEAWRHCHGWIDFMIRFIESPPRTPIGYRAVKAKRQTLIYSGSDCNDAVQSRRNICLAMSAVSPDNDCSVGSHCA